MPDLVRRFFSAMSKFLRHMQCVRLKNLGATGGKSAAKASAERFREYIVFCKWCSLLFIVSFLKKKAMARIVEHIAKVAAVGREKAKSDYRCDK